MEISKRKIIIILVMVSLIGILIFINAKGIIKEGMVFNRISNFKSNDLISPIRIIEDSNNLTGNLTRYKKYYPDNRTLIIEDSNNREILNLRLISSPKMKVSSGNHTLVAEWELRKFNATIIRKMFKSIQFQNRKDNYNNISRVWGLRYATYNNVTKCELRSFGRQCQNITKKTWNSFKNLTEIPKRNLRVGLFTKTVYGESVEFIPNVEGFKISEWASYDVTAGTPLEFDITNGKHNALAEIDPTHYLNTYSGAGSDGWAVVLEVNTTDLTVKKNNTLEFDTGNAQFNELLKIDSTHYFNVYAGVGNDGWIAILNVDPTSYIITKTSSFEYDAFNGADPDVVYVGTVNGKNAYLITYIRGSSLASSRIILVNMTDYSMSTYGSFGEMGGGTNAYETEVSKIDSTHFLSTYHGNSAGRARVLKVNLSDSTNPITTVGSEFTFDGVSANDWNYLLPINSTSTATDFINQYTSSGSDGWVVTLHVDPTTYAITKKTAYEYDPSNGQHGTLAKINDTEYLDAYSGSGTAGTATVLQLEPSLTYTEPGSPLVFDSTNGQHNALINVTREIYLNTFAGAGTDGFAILLNVSVPPAPSTSDTTPPTYSNIAHNQTLVSTLTKFSILWNDETALHPKGQYKFSTNNTGTWVNDTPINFTATSEWANVTKTLNDTAGISIGYRWYASDNAGNLNDTGIQTLTTTTGTCVYGGSGNWTESCSSECVITTNTNIGNNYLVLSGTTGNFTVLANITLKGIEKPNGCRIINKNGDGLGIIRNG